MTRQPNHKALVLAVFSGGLWFFVTWSLGAQVVALAALPFDALYFVLAAALVATMAAALKSPRLASVFCDGGMVLALPALAKDLRARFTGADIFFLVVAAPAWLVALALLATSKNLTPFWMVSTLSVGWSLWRVRFTGSMPLVVLPVQSSDTAVEGLNSRMIALSALLVAVFFLTTIPDADDALYLNLAVGALNNPDMVYARDTMIGVPDLPILKSTYKLETLQLLAALIADFTGVSVVLAAHAIIPLGFLIWTAAVLLLIFGTFLPGAPLLGALAYIAVLTGLGDTFSSYGHTGITRFFHGKGVFVTTVIPLIFFLAIRSQRCHSWRPVWVLTMVFVFSIALNASAIFVAPLVAGLAVLPRFLMGGGLSRSRSLRLLIVLIYPILAAGYLLAFDPPAPSEGTQAGNAGGIFWGVMGSDYAFLLALAAIAVAAISPRLTARWVPAGLYLAGFLLLVINPLLFDFYATHITGYLNYRLFWSVPVPFFLALGATVLWTGSRSWGRWIAAGLVVGLLAAPHSMVHKPTWGWQWIKVDPSAYQEAQAVAAFIPSQKAVLAPEPIAIWIATLDSGTQVVDARRIYALQRRFQISEDEMETRLALIDWVSGQEAAPPIPGAFSKTLEQLNACCIAVARGSAPAAYMADDGQRDDVRQLGQTDHHIVYGLR